MFGTEESIGLPWQTQEMTVDKLSTGCFALPRHSLGIKPSGNAYAARRRQDAGLLGLPDHLVLHILDYLDAKALLRLGFTCKHLLAYARFDELWRALYLSEEWSPFSWRGTWLASYLDKAEEDLLQIDTGVYADALYRPFQCAHTPLAPYLPDSDERVHTISKLARLSRKDFDERWVDRPFILTDTVPEWPVYQSWSTEALVDQYADVTFKAEAVCWPLRRYVDYMNSTSDESPLYLFDNEFVEKLHWSVSSDGDYCPPSCFGEDLFALLGKERPDSRWLIVGPARSGSTFHKDPNATSAWNAVIRGSKYWIMFPPHELPPGVHVSEDASEVTSPLSIAEWLLEFHDEARARPHCLEGVCQQGEVLHVPSGWWHLVVNLEPSVAITQNFVPEAHLDEVLSFLKDKAGQVSGFAPHVTDPHAMFVNVLRKARPDLLSAAQARLEEKAGSKKRKWEAIVNGTSDANGSERADASGFGFGFGFADSDDEIP